jgi:hypothetical protein
MILINVRFEGNIEIFLVLKKIFGKFQSMNRFDCFQMSTVHLSNLTLCIMHSAVSQEFRNSSFHSSLGPWIFCKTSSNHTMLMTSHIPATVVNE